MPSPATQNMQREVEFNQQSICRQKCSVSVAIFISLFSTREAPKPNRAITISLALRSVTRFGVEVWKRKGGKKVAVGDWDLRKEDDTSAVRSLCGDNATGATDIRSRPCARVWGFWGDRFYSHFADICNITLRLKTCETRFHGTTQNPSIYTRQGRAARRKRQKRKKMPAKKVESPVARMDH